MTLTTNDMLQIEHVEPALVLICSFIDNSEQQRLADLALAWGANDEDEFYSKTASGKQILNTHC
jgi:hypothetical protein